MWRGGWVLGGWIALVGVMSEGLWSTHRNSSVKPVTTGGVGATCTARMSIN